MEICNITAICCIAFLICASRFPYENLVEIGNCQVNYVRKTPSATF